MKFHPKLSGRHRSTARRLFKFLARLHRGDGAAASRGVQTLQAEDRLATGWFEGDLRNRAAVVAIHRDQLSSFAQPAGARDQAARRAAPRFVDQTFQREKFLLLDCEVE
jgi:hypothetical protein